jgi:hypothetical protein
VADKGGVAAGGRRVSLLAATIAMLQSDAGSMGNFTVGFFSSSLNTYTQKLPARRRLVH